MAVQRIAIILTLAVVATVGTSIAGYSAYVRSSGVEIVEPHALFRSGALATKDLEKLVLGERLRTVVDLGPDPVGAGERSIIEGFGLRYVRIPFEPSGEASPARTSAFVRRLAPLPQPVLLRSSRGSDGTRLAAALFRLAVLGEAPDVASRTLRRASDGLDLFRRGANADRATFEDFVVHRSGMMDSRHEP